MFSQILAGHITDSGLTGRIAVQNVIPAVGVTQNDHCGAVFQHADDRMPSAGAGAHPQAQFRVGDHAGASGGSVEAATVIIRNAFDNTVWGQERVGAESVTVRCPLRLNLCLSTTPNGALQFFKAATTQNGTLQRLALSTINNPDHVEWTYGEYDKRYADALLPYIDRLKGAKPLVVCQQAQQHIGELQKKEADSLSLSDKDYLVPYVRRAAIIAFREGMMLYIMMGKWTREIADYVEWSLKYQLWCCDRFFGRRIRGAYEDEKAAERGNSAVQKNLLADVPDEFVAEDMKRLFVGLGKKAEAASAYLRQQVKRGNVVRTDNGFRKTERFRQRYEGMV